MEKLKVRKAELRKKIILANAHGESTSSLYDELNELEVEIFGQEGEIKSAKNDIDRLKNSN